MKPLTYEQARAYIRGETPEDITEWRRNHVLSLIITSEQILAEFPTKIGLRTVKRYCENRVKNGEDVIFPVEYKKLRSVCKEIEAKVGILP